MMGEASRLRNRAAKAGSAITMEFLPPENMEIAGQQRSTILYSFRVTMEGKVFYMAFAVGDGPTITPVGQAAMNRACAASPPTGRAIICLNRHVETAGDRTRKAMHDAKHDDVVIVMCATPKIWDAATLSLWDAPECDVRRPVWNDAFLGRPSPKEKGRC